MLSFPRDLSVEIPAPGKPAFLGRRSTRPSRPATEGDDRDGPQGAHGHPDQLLITVDFQGFIKIVDNLGGVYMDVDHRYFNDNTRAASPTRRDRPPPRLPEAERRDALDFVRFRHTDSDFYRNARQQEFVKAVKHQVSGLSARVPSCPAIVDSITQNVEARRLGRGGARFHPSRLRQAPLRAPERAPLPAAARSYLADNSYLRAPGLAGRGGRASVTEFMNPDVEAGDKAATVATGGKPKPSRRAAAVVGVSVEVLNGNGVAGAADDAAYLLGQRGYRGERRERRRSTTSRRRSPTRRARRRRGRGRRDGEALRRCEVVEGASRTAARDDARVIVGRRSTARSRRGRDATPAAPAPKVADAEAARSCSGRSPTSRLLVPTLRRELPQLSTLEGCARTGLAARAPSASSTTALRDRLLGHPADGWTDAPILEGPTRHAGSGPRVPASTSTARSSTWSRSRRTAPPTGS